MAFTILAISLGVLMQIFSGSLRNAERSRDQAQAVALAQSLLAAAGIEGRLAAGESSGDIDGKFRWRSRAAPFQDDSLPVPAAVPTAGSPLELWEVTAEVSWGGDAGRSERTLSLSTLRFQAPTTP